MTSDTQTTLYDAIGGESKVRELVNTFYQIMDSNPEVRELRLQHSENLAEANTKLFEFLSGWLGGPSLYIEKYGHPRLRARHLPFKIGTRERDQWLFCLNQALNDCHVPEPVKSILKSSLSRLADHMRNQNEP